MYNHENPYYYSHPYYYTNPYYFPYYYENRYYYEDPYYASVRQRDNLGTRWEVEEAGWRGVWTRRGNSNVFDARWTKAGQTPITAVMRIRRDGDFVCISRRNSSDGNNCQYSGKIEGRRVRGNYTCDRGGGTWSATILRDRVPDLGSRWEVDEAGWRGVWTRRGNSNIFDARWTKEGETPITAVMRFRQEGDQVFISRRNSSDGNDCDYTGTIEGRRASGTYTCTQGGGNWSARITR